VNYYFSGKLDIERGIIKKLERDLDDLKKKIDEMTGGINTTVSITARLEEEVSDKDELKGQELLKVKSDISALSGAVEGLKQTTEKLTPLLPLSDLDAEELMSKSSYIIVDEKLAHIRTIAENAEKYSKEAKEAAETAANKVSNIEKIHIFILVLYAVVALILFAVGYLAFFG
jgi:hypothetical protein